MNKLAFKWGLIGLIFIGSVALLYPSFEWYSKTPAEREKLEASNSRPKHILNLGLDLRGGSSLLLELDVSKLSGKETLTESKNAKIMNILNTTINTIKKKLEDQTNKKELKPEKYTQIKMQLRQYELIKSIIIYLIAKEYPYISYILGGYKSIHDLCLKYNIPLRNHKSNNCYICSLDDKLYNQTINQLSKNQ